MKSSVRNRLEGTVVHINRGHVVTEIDVKTAAGMVTSVITTRSLDEAGVKEGDTVYAGFKSTNVFIEKP
jgi:molybdopterin-binding protein